MKVLANHTKLSNKKHRKFLNSTRSGKLFGSNKLPLALGSISEKVKERYVEARGWSWQNWRTQRASAAKVLLKVTFTCETCDVLACACASSAAPRARDLATVAPPVSLFTWPRKRKTEVSLLLSDTPFGKFIFAGCLGIHKNICARLNYCYAK